MGSELVFSCLFSTLWGLGLASMTLSDESLEHAHDILGVNVSWAGACENGCHQPVSRSTRTSPTWCATTWEKSWSGESALIPCWTRHLPWKLSPFGTWGNCWNSKVIQGVCCLECLLRSLRDKIPGLIKFHEPSVATNCRVCPVILWVLDMPQIISVQKSSPGIIMNHNHHTAWHRPSGQSEWCESGIWCETRQLRSEVSFRSSAKRYNDDLWWKDQRGTPGHLLGRVESPRTTIERTYWVSMYFEDAGKAWWNPWIL